MRKVLLAAALFVCAGVFAGAASAQTDVTVTNPKSNPVLIRDVDNDAKRPYQVAFSIGQATFPTVPPNKVFVIEYISGTIRINSASDGPPCRILQMSFGLSSANTIDVIPVYMGASSSLNDIDVNFFSISQPVKIYAMPNGDLGGTSQVLSQGCNGLPTSSTIVLSGHLEKAN
jgi:hypothetical protein